MINTYYTYDINFIYNGQRKCKSKLNLPNSTMFAPSVKLNPNDTTDPYFPPIGSTKVLQYVPEQNNWIVVSVLI